MNHTNLTKLFAATLVTGLVTLGTALAATPVAPAKPQPEPLLAAARRLGIAPAHCVYVGDDERDIVAGLAAGMATVAATYGYLGHEADPTRWGAHASINSPGALLQLLAKA